MLRPSFIVFVIYAGLIPWGCGSSGSGDDVSPMAGQAAPTSYPEGPYGVEVGDVMANHTLITDTEDSIAFAALHADPAKTLLLIFGTAGWCARCSIHMPDLKGLYTEFSQRGLFMVASLHENRSYEPAVPRDAMNFRRLHELPFSVLADTDGQLTQYYERTTIPMVMVVDLRTMTLLQAELTWDVDAVRALIEAEL